MKVRESRVKAKQERVRRHTFGSSRVDQGWYYPAKGVIRLRFPDGVVWEYEGCSEQDWNGLIAAKSAGVYIHDVLDLRRHHAA